MSESIAETHLRELVAAIADKHPVPAGGSAGVAAAAMGVGLALLATRVWRGSPHPILLQSEEQLLDINRQLIPLFTEDCDAFSAVLAASRLSGAEKERALQQAYARATDVPLQVTELALTTLKLIAQLQQHARPALKLDVDAARSLLRTGAQISLQNAQSNLKSASAGSAKALHDRLLAAQKELQEQYP